MVPLKIPQCVPINSLCIAPPRLQLVNNYYPTISINDINEVEPWICKTIKKYKILYSLALGISLDECYP